MKKLCLLFLALLMVAACKKEYLVPRPDPEPGENYADHPKHAAYQAALDNYRRSVNAPGAILLISRRDEPLWIGASGQANLEYRTSMTTNTPFRVGSITKVFVATAILRLVEEGRLSLEDRLNQRLPKVVGRIPSADNITIRHLLGHLSGIVDPPNESKAYQLEIADDPGRIDAMSLDELLENYVYGKRLHFPPGSAYSYSNTNYWLLGQIMESVTKQSVHQVLDQLIFRPLSLSHTYLEKRDDRNVARGYVDLYGDGKLIDVSRWDRADTDGKPDGGIISTAKDLMVFLRALMNGTLITSNSVRLMQQIQLESCDDILCEYGLGLEIWRTGAGIAFGHNGGSIGIEANTLYFPDSDHLFVLYKNNGNGSDKSFLDHWMQ